jgi:hypothetical protein
VKLRRVMLPLGVAFVATAALAAPQWSWTRTSSLDAAFSVETPCNEAEVAAAGAGPGKVGMVQFPEQSRVVCFTSGMVMLAGVIEAPPGEVRENALFDLITGMAASDPDKQGQSRSATVDGRRAWFNRDSAGKMLAQTGMIEIDRSRIVLMIVGGEADGELSLEDQTTAIDRFSSSIKLAVAPE